jgi:hypothetical protein
VFKESFSTYLKTAKVSVEVFIELVSETAVAKPMLVKCLETFNDTKSQTHYVMQLARWSSTQDEDASFVKFTGQVNQLIGFPIARSAISDVVTTLNGSSNSKKAILQSSALFDAAMMGYLSAMSCVATHKKSMQSLEQLGLTDAQKQAFTDSVAALMQDVSGGVAAIHKIAEDHAKLMVKEAMAVSEIDFSKPPSQFLVVVDKVLCNKMKSKYDPLKLATAHLKTMAGALKLFEPDLSEGIAFDANEIALRLRAGVATWGLYTLMARDGWNVGGTDTNKAIQALCGDHFTSPKDDGIRQLLPLDVLASVDAACVAKQTKRALVPEVKTQEVVATVEEPDKKRARGRAGRGRGRGRRGTAVEADDDSPEAVES